MTSVTDSKRLKILSDDEINVFYARLTFTPEERKLYYTLSPEESRAFNALTIHSHIQCILELGYFKAQHQFFTFSLADVLDDLETICHRYFPTHTLDMR